MKKLQKFRVFLPTDMYLWLVGLSKVEHKTVSIKLEEIIQKEMTGNE